MWKFPKKFHVIVIGAGHAGYEAAHACGMRCDTLLLTPNIDRIGWLSCNPSIGGAGKGHLVREIDAIGGVMGQIADQTCIHSRMLNASKGAAIHSPRAQVDKLAYHATTKYLLENTPHLEIKQATVMSLLTKDDQIEGVVTQEGIFFAAECVVLAAGTFMRGLIHVGEANYAGGRAGDQAVSGLSSSLETLGFQLKRFKTGTPPRLNGRSIDFSKTEEQKPEDVYFSFDDQKRTLPQMSCFITYTNQVTQKIVLENLNRSPLYSGKIQSVGPRYCPSIEDKFMRFKDKQRHQLFLEPEGVQTHEIYANGISSSLPFDVQVNLVRTIRGLEQAEIMRPAYAIEYDYVTAGQIDPTLETKRIQGLFFAGQINGTTGYEEAAAQGLIAGINAMRKVEKKPLFVPKRSESYIGVLIDDLTTKELFNEPYRIFTSRAEYRLLLRQDNADLRLRHYGYEFGLISSAQYEKLQDKKRLIQKEIKRLQNTYVTLKGKTVSLAKLLSRPDMTYTALEALFPEKITRHPKEISSLIEIDFKYSGYIEREKSEIEHLSMLDKELIPKCFDYFKITGLRKEAQEKLSMFQPYSLGQAIRISGVSPADICVLRVSLKKHQSSVSNSPIN